MKKKGKIVKKIFIVLGILLLILAGVIVYFVVQDLKQEDILKQEIINYSNMDLANDDYSIYIKTKGNYGYIEEAIKKYYKELSDNVKIINYYLDDEELSNVLSLDNLEKDRPACIKSYAVIQKDRSKVTKAIERISYLCDEENVRNLVDKEKIDDYSYEFYEKIMLTEKDIKDLKDTKEKMDKISKDLNLFFDKVIEILDLLKNNDDKWSSEGGKLYFEGEDLVNKYNTLYKELVDIAASFDDSDISNKKSNNESVVA